MRACRPAVGVSMLFALLGCAHGQSVRTELQEANDAFAREIRWSDLSGLGKQIVPERQAEFFRMAVGGEESLKIAEYEMLDVALGEDKAVVHSKVSWYREPSITTKTEPMSVLWERKNGAWFIASILGGPLPLPPAPANPK